MLYWLISIIAILFTIFFVVGTHEAAHFLMARLMGVKVLRFSIGFGKVLFRLKDKKETEYVFALIPLGGYVQMLDETEGKVNEEEKKYAFNRQPYYKKFLIVLAGPVTNLLCAVLLYWFIYVLGFTTIKPIIGKIEPNSIASLAGIKGKQEIIGVDDATTENWTSVLFRMIAHIGDQDTLKMTVKNLTDNNVSTHQLNLSNWQMNNLTPDPLTSLGIKPYEPEIPVIVGKIAENSPASSSLLKLGDKILSVEGNKIEAWSQLTTLINHSPDKKIKLDVLRNNKLTHIEVEVGSKRNVFQQVGYLGVGPNYHYPENLQRKIKLTILSAFPKAFSEVAQISYFNFLLLGKMLIGKLSMQSLGGPITIFESAGNALYYGFLSFLGFLAFLSIAVGIINLIPLPGLDGGHLLIYTIELIIRRPLSVRVLDFLYRMGFIVIFLVLVQAFVNDILRL